MGNEPETERDRQRGTERITYTHTKYTHTHIDTDRQTDRHKKHDTEITHIQTQRQTGSDLEDHAHLLPRPRILLLHEFAEHVQLAPLLVTVDRRGALARARLVRPHHFGVLAASDRRKTARTGA